jgi:hypothetical protein
MFTIKIKLVIIKSKAMKKNCALNLYRSIVSMSKSSKGMTAMPSMLFSSPTHLTVPKSMCNVHIGKGFSFSG